MKAWLAAGFALVAGCRAPVTSVGEYSPGVHAGDAGAVQPLPDAARPRDAAFHAEASADGFYVEAEDGSLTTGFTRGSDPTASGGAYVITAAGDPSNAAPGLARAVYRVRLDAPGTYVIWGRIHSPDVARNAFWFRVDDGSWFVWRLATGEDWYWGTLHDNVDYNHPIEFTLTEGAHQLELANFIDGVSLDRLYFTTGSERPAGDDTPCRPPDSVKLGGVCVQSCGSQGGTTCGDTVCAGRPPIPAYDCAVCCVGA